MKNFPMPFKKTEAILSAKTDNKDLFFAPEKHEGWVNVYRGLESGKYTALMYSKAKNWLKEQGKAVLQQPK